MNIRIPSYNVASFQCPHCKGVNLTYYCYGFINSTIGQYYQAAKKAKLWFSCLCFHWLSCCSFQKTCCKCLSNKHNSFLHLEFSMRKLFPLGKIVSAAIRNDGPMWVTTASTSVEGNSVRRVISSVVPHSSPFPRTVVLDTLAEPSSKIVMRSIVRWELLLIRALKYPQFLVDCASDLVWRRNNTFLSGIGQSRAKIQSQVHYSIE